MDRDKSPYQKIDVFLIFIIFAFAIVSLLAIHSAQPILPKKLQNVNFIEKQITWYIIGFAAIAATMIIDYDRLKQFHYYLYGFGMLLLVGIELFGPSKLIPIINNTTSWYSIPGLGNFQPAELMKLFLIITISYIIAKHNEKYPVRTYREDFILIAKILGVSIPPIILVLKQPDLGTVTVFLAIIAFLTVISGIKWRLIIGLIVAVIVSIMTLVVIHLKFPAFFNKYILHEYQLNRFYAWLSPHENPDLGYQLIQSLLAIGSGQLGGKGSEDIRVYFPEAHTDFIFAVIGEQFGFIGASIVISLFFLLIYRMIHISLECNDPFGSYICTGIIGMFTFQVFQNIGMTIQLMPITGIPLPFISYGGSSLLTYMIAIGLVLNVRSRTRKYMFGEDNA